VIARILRVLSFFRLDWLAHSAARAQLGIVAPFGDDALAYCSELMDPETTRVALAAALHQAKRNKAFESSRCIGLAVDGAGAWRTYKGPCPLCDPIKDAKGELHLALDPAGIGDRTSLPAALSASRRSRRSQRHEFPHLPLDQPEFPPSYRHWLSHGPRGPAGQSFAAL
jgi:hypothetical protein